MEKRAAGPTGPAAGVPRLFGIKAQYHQRDTENSHNQSPCSPCHGLCLEPQGKKGVNPWMAGSCLIPAELKRPLPNQPVQLTKRCVNEPQEDQDKDDPFGGICMFVPWTGVQGAVNHNQQNHKGR